MTQTQFLIILIALIPLFNAITIKICSNSDKMVSGFNKLFPILYLVNLIGIYGNLNRDNSYVTVIEAIRGISLSFDVDELGLKFLFLLGFIWLTFAFYMQRFFTLHSFKNALNMKIFIILIFSFLNLIILSKNLLTILFFYNCLIILSHFFSLIFLHKGETKFSNFFTFLLYLESILFFFAIVATFKFVGHIEFTRGGILADNVNSFGFSALLLLYVCGLFLSIIVPCYLFFNNINLEPIILYALFFLSYAFGSIYILIKILTFTFGLDIISGMMSSHLFSAIEVVFLLNILAVSGFLIFSKGLKSSFFYLLFQQFSVVIFTILFWSFFDPKKIQLTALSFFLSITLFFIAISNIILYLGKAKNKEMRGIFFKTKVNVAFLVCSLMNMSGIFFGAGGVEKFLLIKTIISKKMWLSAIIYGVNFFTLCIFFVKMVLPFFMHNNNNEKTPVTTKKNDDNDISDDSEIANEINYDSSLILGGLAALLLLVLSAVFYPVFSQFFS